MHAFVLDSLNKYDIKLEIKFELFYLLQLLVSATGVNAFAINLSIYWIIGNTSPLTYPFGKIEMESKSIIISKK